MVRTTVISARTIVRSAGIQLIMMTIDCSTADHRITKLELYWVSAVDAVTGFMTDPTKLISDKLIKIASPTFLRRAILSFQIIKTGKNT